VQTGGISLTIETLQMSHEALVQLRANNAQATLAKARAMNEIEGLLKLFEAQQAAQQAQQQEAQATDAPAEAPAPAPAPAPARKRTSRSR